MRLWKFKLGLVVIQFVPVAVAMSADLGTAFTYQGYLKKNGVAVTDPACQFRVGLWDSNPVCAGGSNNGNGCHTNADCPGGSCFGGASQVGASPQTDTAGVTNGLFMITLNYGADAIDGTARWLEIEIKCTGDTDFTMLTSRVKLTPAPHALALPGLYTEQNVGGPPNIIGGYSGNSTGALGAVGATICGGGNDDGPNIATGLYSTIGGGTDNIVNGFTATISGGLGNRAPGNVAVIGGGDNNNAAGSWSTINGGQSNSALADYSAVGGGTSNIAFADHSTVGGGHANYASANYSTIGGGQGNAASGMWSTIAGGGGEDDAVPFPNLATDDWTTVGGGMGNQAGDGIADTSNAIGGTVGGGTNNSATGKNSFVGGGHANTASAQGAAIGGGYVNQATAKYSTIGGGGTAPTLYECTNFPGSGSCAFCVGGTFATSSCVVDAQCGVGGTCVPNSNTCQGGGTCVLTTSAGNVVYDDFGIVAGGGANTAGDNNSDPTNAQFATVGGGLSNIASGFSSTVPGGQSNQAAGEYSLAAGRQAKANHTGAFVWADTGSTSDFVSNGPNQFLIRAAGGVGINTNNPGGGTLAVYSQNSGTTGDAMINLVADFDNNNEDDNPYIRFGHDGATNTAYLGLIGNDGTGFDSGQSITDSLANAFMLHHRVAGFPIQLATSGAVRMTLDSSGKVGIGTTTPAQALDVSGSIHASGMIVSGSSITIDGTAGSERISSSASLDFNTAAGRVLRLENNATSPNLIGGYSGNSVTSGVLGATIGGGGVSATPNRVTDLGGTVSGGRNNRAGDNAGTTSDRTFATVGGGLSNWAAGTYSTIAGGSSNTASGANGATIGGGAGNGANGDYSTVGGGTGAQANGDNSTVGGGVNNIASGDSSTVSGGMGDHATGAASTVGGGTSNTASADNSTVGGGGGNSALGFAALVPGGQENQAGGSYSFAAGRRAKVRTAAQVGGGDTDGDEGTFVWADANSTGADFNSTGPNKFLVRAIGGTTIYSNSGLTAGVTLAAGGGAWASVSDRNLKENFAEVDTNELLEHLAQIPLTTWNYKSQDPAIRHIGVMAQDFYAAFGVGEEETKITTIDSDGVALAAIQGLYQIVQDKDCQITELSENEAEKNQRINQLEAQNEDLTRRLEAVEKLVRSLSSTRK